VTGKNPSAPPHVRQGENESAGREARFSNQERPKARKDNCRPLLRYVKNWRIQTTTLSHQIWDLCSPLQDQIFCRIVLLPRRRTLLCCCASDVVYHDKATLKTIHRKHGNKVPKFPLIFLPSTPGNPAKNRKC